jgi:hypothetical protein
LIDFENGSWLYNLSPQVGEAHLWRNLRRVAAAADALEIERIGVSLDEIADLLERAGNSKAASWGDFLRSADPNGQLKTLEQSIAAELPHAWERLESYTLKHFDCDPGT